MKNGIEEELPGVSMEDTEEREEEDKGRAVSQDNEVVQNTEYFEKYECFAFGFC